ncbi:MAG: hypothetical protein ACK5LJ_09220 [Paracoccus sp. (in: a-proteobacteria)]
MIVNDLLREIRASAWRLKHLHAGLAETDDRSAEMDPDLLIEVWGDLREEIVVEAGKLAALFAEAESLGLMTALAEHTARHIAVEVA